MRSVGAFVLALIAVAGVGAPAPGASEAAAAGRLVEYVLDPLPAGVRPLSPEPYPAQVACVMHGSRCVPEVASTFQQFVSEGFRGDPPVGTDGPVPELALPAIVEVTTRTGAPPGELLREMRRLARGGSVEHVKIDGVQADLWSGDWSIVSWEPAPDVHVDVATDALPVAELIRVARSLRPKPIVVDTSAALPRIVGRAPQPRGHRGDGSDVTLVMNRDGDEVSFGTLFDEGYGVTFPRDAAELFVSFSSEPTDYVIGLAPPSVRTVRVEVPGRTFDLPTVGRSAELGVVVFALYRPYDEQDPDPSAPCVVSVVDAAGDVQEVWRDAGVQGCFNQEIRVALP